MSHVLPGYPRLTLWYIRGSKEAVAEVVTEADFMATFGSKFNTLEMFSVDSCGDEEEAWIMTGGPFGWQHSDQKLDLLTPRLTPAINRPHVFAAALQPRNRWLHFGAATG